MLLVQGRGEMAFMTIGIAVLLNQFAMDIVTDGCVFSQGTEEMPVRSAVTEIRLYQCAMDNVTDCSVVSTG